MYFNWSIVLQLFVFVWQCNCQLPDKPTIDTLEISPIGSVKIGWSINNSQVYQFTRIRIQYSIITDTTHQSDFFDYPYQVAENLYDSAVDAFAKYDTDTNIDCYNRCIQNANCSFVVRYYQTGLNCYLKATYNTSDHTPLPIGASAKRLANNIDNPIILINFPLYQIFTFRISLYDNTSQKWSDFSNESNQLDLNLGLTLSVRRLTNQKLELHWYKNSSFPAVSTLSRYNLHVFVNNSAKYRSYQIVSNEFAQLVPKYFNINSLNDTIVINTHDAAACHQFCTSYEKCIVSIYVSQYDPVYDYQENNCIVKSKFDFRSGIVIPPYMKSFSLIDNDVKWIFKDVVEYTNYTFQLKGVTPYGDEYSSPLVEYTPTTLPVTYTYEYKSYDMMIKILVNSTNLPDNARYLINYTNDDPNIYYYYYEKSPLFYNDPNNYDGGGDTFYDCYERCVYNDKCLAIRWGQYPYYCTHITNISVSTPCSHSASCTTISKFSSLIKMSPFHGAKKLCFNVLIRSNEDEITYVSNRSCVDLTGFDVHVNMSSEAIDGENVELTCIHNEINPELVESISWAWSDDQNYYAIVGGNYGFELLNNNYTLKINKLDHSLHDGDYHCEVKLKSMDFGIRSKNIKLTIKYPITLSVPSKKEYVSGDNATIECTFDGYPIPELRWRSLNTSQDIQSTFIQNNILYLLITNLTRQQSDTYICYTVNSTSEVASNVTVTVRSKPSKPIIETIDQIDQNNQFYLKWNIEDDGLYMITKVIIEISNDFNNTDFKVISFDVPYTEWSSYNEFNFTATIDDKSYLRIKAKNYLGFSESSEPVFIKTTSKKTVYKEKFLVAFILSCVGLAVAVIALVYSLFHKRIRKRFKRERSGSTIVNEEIMNYIPRFLVAEKQGDNT